MQAARFVCLFIFPFVCFSVSLLARPGGGLVRPCQRRVVVILSETGSGGVVVRPLEVWCQSSGVELVGEPECAGRVWVRPSSGIVTTAAQGSRQMDPPSYRVDPGL